MKKLLITFLFILFTFTSNIVWSDDFDKGFKAYNSGDFAAAVKWFTLAAEQGDADAQFNLGLVYWDGEGVSQDIKAAMKWFTLAAEQGDADAQNILGVMYDEGEGVSQNIKAAMKWFKLAAEQGNAHAQYNLGAIYHNGESVPRDIKTATKWFKLAAEQGHADAQKTLEVYQDVDNILENDRGFFTKIIDLIKLGFKNIFS